MQMIVLSIRTTNFQTKLVTQLPHISISLTTFTKKWGIKINPTKSEAICIRNASGKCHRLVVPQSKNLSLPLDGIQIPFKTSLKYLGVTFSYLFRFNQHGRLITTKAKKVAGMYAGILKSKYLPSQTKLLIYKVAIRPLLIYAFPIWFSISPVVANNMEIFERNVLRKCLNKNFQCPSKRYSNEFIYTNASIKPLCHYAMQQHLKFVERLEHHENPLMNEIFEANHNTSWTSSTYLSSVGILHEDLNNVNLTSPPQFYIKAVPCSHRG